MLNASIRIGLSVLFLLFTLQSQATATEQNPKSPPLSEEQKMEQIKGYFESEYQEEDYFKTDRLLLTATGSLKPVHKAPSVASVITAEDIQQIGARTLDEVLETVPGLHVSVSNKNAMDLIYSIRGIQTSLNPHVLFLLNGNPLTFTFTGSRLTTMNLPVANISRVEVVRGPGSAVYGADAFAGTINIITKTGQEIDGTSAGGTYGSFDGFDGWLEHGGLYSGWDIAFTIEVSKSDGDDGRIIDSDLQSILDSGFGTSASLAPGPLLADYELLSTNLEINRDKLTARLWYWMNEYDGIRDGVTQLLSETGNTQTEQFLAEIMYSDKNFANNLAISARLTYMYEKLDAYLQLFPSGAVLPIGLDGNFVIPPDANSKFVLFTDGAFGNPIQEDFQYYGDLTFLYTGFRDQQFRFSTGIRYIEGEYAEYKNFGPGVLNYAALLPPTTPPGFTPVDGTLTDVTGTSGIFCEDQSRTVWFLSLQDEWSLARKWELTAGVRYDHYSDFGETVNPRLALVWETKPYLTSKLLYGEAFRPPSFAELYNKNNPSNLGNPDLDPETIRTLELAFDYHPVSKFRTILSLFTYDIDDLIELAPDPAVSGDLIAQNLRDQEGYGFELEATWQMFKSFQIKGNIGFQHSEDKDTGIDVPDAPQLQAYLNAHWKFYPEWSFDAQWFWIGNRERVAGDPRPEIDDYSVVNLVLRRKNIASHWDVALLAKNVFDEDVREPSLISIPNDYPMEGRSIYGEVRFHF